MQINAVRAGLPRMASTSEALKQVRDQIRVEKDAFRSKMETLKTEVKAKREQEKIALKTKLQAIRDDAKKAAVQRLDENMNKLNSSFAEKWTTVLTDLDTHLARLIDKASTTSATDTTAFTAAVDAARSAIASARTAVQAQAQKTYNFAISTEATLKTDVSAAREVLNTDLKSVKDLVQSAHLAVVKVLNEFNKIK